MKDYFWCTYLDPCIADDYRFVVNGGDRTAHRTRVDHGGKRLTVLQIMIRASGVRGSGVPPRFYIRGGMPLLPFVIESLEEATDNRPEGVHFDEKRIVALDAVELHVLHIRNNGF